MIHPIDNEKKTFLLFSFYRSKELALKYFVSALKALYYAAVDRKKFVRKSNKDCIIVSVMTTVNYKKQNLISQKFTIFISKTVSHAFI
jgi:hypothetical protein